MYYGWAIVALTFVAQFAVMGTVIQCFPVFLLPLAEEFEIGRSVAALPPAAILICGIVVGPTVGRIVAVYPIRNVMLVGAVAMSAGFALLAHTTSFWQFLVVFGLTGSFSLSALGTISCNSLIVNWFEHKRALALGLAMIGMSISGAVMIPIATAAEEAWGWRNVFLAFSALFVALTPAIALLVETRPSDRGLLPYGAQPDRQAEGAATNRVETAEPGLPLGTRALLSQRSLWLIAAACGLAFFGATGIMNHGIAFAVDRGIAPMKAAVLLSAISIGAAFGKLVFGDLGGRFGERGAFGIALVCMFIAYLVLGTAGSYAALVAAAALFGLGVGGIAPLQAALLAQEFGDRNFAPVMGLAGPLMIPFQITGPPLAGYLFDTRGSYDLAIWIFMGGIVASAMALLLLRPTTASLPAT